MKKIKFQIKGMDCASCASLIEEKLKNRPGIIQVKVNYSSEKASVVYDEENFKESELSRIIKEAGNFQVEKIPDPVPSLVNDKSDAVKNDAPQAVTRITNSSQASASPKIFFLLGLLTAISIASMAVDIYLLSASGGVVSGQRVAANVANPTPSPAAQPTPDNTPPPVQNFEITAKNHVRGDFKVPITLVEFSDFECPFCEKHFPTVNKILSSYPGKVRLVYKHFPLSFHQNSQKAAEASECADEQGKFWEYHDELFKNQQAGFSVDKFKQWAADLNLDSEQFNDCLDSDKYKNKVQADYQEGGAKGVQGTPATFVNGKLVSGALPYESFSQIIDQELSAQ